MREKLLLDILKEKEIVSLKNIIATLELSERTIRTEIKDLNRSGLKKGFKISNIRGKGYSLEVSDNMEFEKFYESLNEKINFDINYNQDERINKILELLLVAKERVTIDFIAEKLGYSRSTIIKDLALVDKKLKIFNLDLERKSNKGLKINSDEIHIRKALSSYLYSNNGDFIIQNKVNYNTFNRVKKIFIEEIIKNDIDISNLAIENIFCHLKILILRINNKSFLNDEVDINNFQSKFKSISKKICDCIRKELNVEIPEKEIDYLASQICYKSRTIIQENEVKFRAMMDIDDILKDIDERFYTNFSNDIELKNHLLIHLCALISRARTNTQLKNPYFDEVNTRYSAIVSIVVNFTDEFCKRWNLNLLKDEIAFITIHFATHFEKARLKTLTNVKKIAIVCPQDGGLHYFLRLKIEENFRNVVIDAYTYIQVENLDFDKYDFVISDRKIEGFRTNTPIFILEKVFDNKEFEGIVKKIEKIIESNNKKSVDILDGITFKRMLGGKKVDYKKLLEEEANRLANMGIVDEDFYKSVLKREEILSTAYQNNIAAPHGIEMDANKNFLSVINFENMIEWGDKKVSTMFLIAMKKGSLKLNTTIANKIFNLINDNEKRAFLKNIKSDVEFEEFFESL